MLSSASISSSSSSKFSSISCVSTGLSGARTGAGARVEVEVEVELKVGCERREGGGTEGAFGAVEGAERVACEAVPEGSRGVLNVLLASMCMGDTTLKPSSLLSLPLLSTCVYELDDSLSFPCPPKIEFYQMMRLDEMRLD